MKSIKNDLAILVLSCDKYADLWSPFFRQFKKYFPIGDLPIYLGSNLISCNEPNVETILSGPDRDWSSSLKKILEQITETNVFIILEDLFLIEPIDHEAFSAALEVLREKNAMHIKYWAIPMQIMPGENPKIGEYPKGAPFRATVCGFWNRQYLIDLLIEGENPWNFEILGSYRTSYTDGFYSLTRPLTPYLNMVEKGCWIHRSVVEAERIGIPIEVHRRPVLAGTNNFLSRFKIFFFDSIIRVPWRWRVALMNKLRRLLVSY